MRVAVLGRFQPFHWGHFEYAAEAAARGATHLVVGITNPAADRIRMSRADPNRSASAANPFTYEQRREMAAGTLARLLPQVTPDYRPCDLRTPGLLRASLGSCDLVALTIYDAWGEEKADLVRAAGYRVDVMWQRKEKLVTGTEVRRRIEAGEPWGHLVPSGTAVVIERILGGAAR